MTNSEQAIREKAINIFADIFTAGGEAHEVGGQSFDQLQQSGYIDRKLSDLTALISEHYVAKAAYIALENTLAKAEAKNLELLQQRDELREAINSLLFMTTGRGEPCGDLNWDAAEKRAITVLKSIRK